MNVKKLAIAAVAVAATLGAGLAEAGGRDHVQWSVTIGAPAPVFVGPPVRIFEPVPIHNRGYYDRGYYDRGYDDRGHHPGQARARGWRDADRDGIPNRFDRVYNPRWDRDGDGVPNRYDRHDNTRHHGWRDRGHDGRHGR